MKTYAIIPSGGIGTRFGDDLPKQYLQVKGKELIAYTLETFQKSDLVDEVIVAAQPDFFGLLQKIRDNYSITKLSKIIEGGKERQDSVYNALSSLTADDDDIVAVHDAARPLLPLSILNSAISSAKKSGNCVVAIKARDTLADNKENNLHYLDRSSVYYLQTPQIFRFGTLKAAMKNAYDQNFMGTDESIIVNRMGEHINFLEGSFLNFKITTKADLDLFEQLC